MKKILTSLLCGFVCFPAFSQWNSNTAVNLEISSLQASDLNAVGTSDGKTWIAFYSADGPDFDMRAQLLDADGNKLLGSDGVLVDSFPSGSATYVFNACLDAENNLIIAAQDMRNGVDLQTVAYKVDQSGASLWNGADGVVLGDGLAPYPAILASGEVIFAWSGNSGTIEMQKVDEMGNLVWSSPKSFSLSSGHPSRGQIAGMSDSGFVMVYQKGSFGINSTLFAQRFDKDGAEVWSAPLQLSDEATSLARYYSLKQDADTTYFGYYSSSMSNHFNSWLQRINPDGTLPYGINGAAFSDYSAAGDPQEQTTHIALDATSPYVWAVSTFSNSLQSEYGIYVQKFNKTDGTRMFNVNGKEIYPIGSDRYAQQGGLALLNDGPVFMFCGDNDYVIKGTALDSSGNFILPTQDVELSSSVVTQPALYKGRFAFTDNVNGQSVAVWTENRGADYLAYAQNMDLSMYDTSVVVTTENGVPATINSDNGTLQMVASVSPSTASQDVTWSLSPGTGDATISTSGLVTALEDGTVWAKAVSIAAPTYADSMEITISNQENAINEMAKLIGLTIFPNPATDIINIEIKNAHPELSVSLTDIKGRVLQKITIPARQASSNLATMNLSGLSVGFYLLQIDGDNIHISQKITRR